MAEQAGIFGGTEGVHIDVGGITTLRGSLIDSKAGADKKYIVKRGGVVMNNFFNIYMGIFCSAIYWFSLENIPKLIHYFYQYRIPDIQVFGISVIVGYTTVATIATCYTYILNKKSRYRYRGVWIFSLWILVTIAGFLSYPLLIVLMVLMGTKSYVLKLISENIAVFILLVFILSSIVVPYIDRYIAKKRNLNRICDVANQIELLQECFKFDFKLTSNNVVIISVMLFCNICFEYIYKYVYKYSFHFMEHLHLWRFNNYIMFLLAMTISSILIYSIYKMNIVDMYKRRALILFGIWIITSLINLFIYINSGRYFDGIPTSLDKTLVIIERALGFFIVPTFLTIYFDYVIGRNRNYKSEE